MRLTICLLFILLWSSPLGAEDHRGDMQEHARSIASNLFQDGDNHLALNIIKESWYKPHQNENIREEVRLLVVQHLPSIEKEVGELSQKVIYLGEIKIGRISELVFYIQGAYTDFPLKLNYIVRDEGFSLIGLQFGNTVADSLYRLAQVHPVTRPEDP